MTTITAPKGIVRFRIKGQEARAPWERKLLAAAISNGDGAPNDLRFQCRIAQDARDNFADIEVPGGKLSIHPRSKPQFGRDRHGRAYLTVVLVDSRDGESYKYRWYDDAVPRKMQEVAVKHDEGRRVSPTTVGLRWDDAEITVSDHIDRRPRHDIAPDGTPHERRTDRPTTTRQFGRLCATDL